MDNNIGNISTIATWLAITITGILTYFGYETDYQTLLPVISSIITLVIAIWSSKNPNNLEILGNKHSTPDENLVLNHEYETGEEDGC